MMSANKGNILIVEDEILIASQIKLAIVEHGYNCAGIAINFSGAKAILKTKDVDLVLIDVKLSGEKTGFDIAEFINKNVGIPFLFITSYNDGKTLEKIKKLKPLGYINKPINDATLLTNLDLLLEKKSKKENEIITILLGTVSYNINLSKLLYVEADHVYLRLYFTTKELLLRTSLKSFLGLLPKASLIQISRGIAVNKEFIEQNTSTKVKLTSKEFKISKSFKDDFLKYISE